MEYINMLNVDEYGEVINGEKTYKEIAYQLKSGKSIIIGWTDENYTHYDVLFSLNVEKEGNLQHGLRWTDLFVSIIGIGAFGFVVDGSKNSGYIGEKLNLGNNITTEKLTELINGIIENLKR